VDIQVNRQPVVGYVDLADPRLGPDITAGILKRGAELVSAVEAHGIKVVTAGRVVCSESELPPIIDRFLTNQCCGIILRTAWFLRSNTPVGIAQRSGLPCLLWAETNPHDTGFEALALTHGAFEEVGIRHQLHYGDTSARSMRRILAWCYAAHFKKRIFTSTYGEVGGRALEMLPGSSDHNQLRRLFGLHVDNTEQWSLIHKAEEVPDSEWKPIAESWRTGFRHFTASQSSLEKSARLYVAGNQVFRERRWDFAGIQCQTEMIDSYLSPCLPIAQWNEDGFTVACETDINNAISMFFIQSVTHKPAMFADVYHYDPNHNVIHALNCGTAAPTVAGGRDKVDIKEQTPLQGTWDEENQRSLCKGGCCTNFVMPAGVAVTFVRFGRLEGQYVIHLAKGKTMERPPGESELQGLNEIWPFAFVQLEDDTEPSSFIWSLRAHHAAFALGDCADIVQEYANLSDIPVLGSVKKPPLAIVEEDA
jgi:L-fucose isomerase